MWLYFNSIFQYSFTVCQLNNSQWYDSSGVVDTMIQLSLAQLFNSHKHDCSTVLAQLVNSHWYDSSLVAGTTVQQSLVRLFNSHWHNCSTVTGTIVQQTLVRLIKSHRHDFSLVAGTTVQQSLVRLFNSGGRHDCSTVTGKIFFLCWQNSLTVKITVKELCHVPGIQHLIQSWLTIVRVGSAKPI